MRFVRGQALKVAITAACLSSTILSNKHLGIEKTSRTYTPAIILILAYDAVTEPKTENKTNTVNKGNESGEQKSWLDTYGLKNVWKINV